MTTTTDKTARFTYSADGTRIAYEVHGSGPALVLVDGALCQRTMGPSRGLAKALGASFTVYAYDRRGRGESGAGESPYHPDREVEDLVALTEAAGGHAHVLGTDLPARTRSLVDEGRRGEAVRLFMRTVGTPALMVTLLPLFPVWKKLTGVAHTLPHDWDLCIEHEQGRPLRAGLYDASTAPTLAIAGGKSPAFMKNAQAAIAEAVPHGRYLELAGQTHMVKAKVLAPVVTEFLLGS